MLGVLGLQTCRQYPVHRVTRNYILCLGQRGKKQCRPTAHLRVGHIGEYPPPSDNEYSAVCRGLSLLTGGLTQPRAYDFTMPDIMEDM